MINFRKIDEDNFDAILAMKRPDDEHFVSTNAKSLAQAWLYRDNNDVFPFAIYNDDDLVGFMMLEEDNDEKVLIVWRIMFPEENTNKGYGRQAIEKVIELARKANKYKYIHIDYDVRNERAKHLYRKIGFKETGEIENGDEVIMHFPL